MYIVLTYKNLLYYVIDLVFVDYTVMQRKVFPDCPVLLVFTQLARQYLLSYLACKVVFTVLFSLTGSIYCLTSLYLACKVVFPIFLVCSQLARQYFLSFQSVLSLPGCISFLTSLYLAYQVNFTVLLVFTQLARQFFLSYQ